MTDKKTVDEKFAFEDLKVYKKALNYVDLVYAIAKTFPQVEVYSLADQFRRASVSICLNIAEGTGGSTAEFKRFLKIARRSLRECVAITDIAYRQEFVTLSERETLRCSCVELSKMLSGLIGSLQR
jgi:four helix bundle protein